VSLAVIAAPKPDLGQALQQRQALLLRAGIGRLGVTVYAPEPRPPSE
jgi:hypothetical protein